MTLLRLIPRNLAIVRVPSPSARSLMRRASVSGVHMPRFPQVFRPVHAISGWEVNSAMYQPFS